MELNNNNANEILTMEFPLRELLQDSVFYPCCYSDGRIIRLLNMAWRKLEVNSYILVDAMMSSEQFLEHEMNSVHGYHVLAHRAVKESEYISPEWKLEIHPDEVHKYTAFCQRMKETPFAHWVVYERNSDRNESFGPECFSLFYVGGSEAITVFEQLYITHNIPPKVFCAIQCWPGLAGGNWTDFSHTNGTLMYLFNRHHPCVPEWICLGNMGEINNIYGMQRIKNTSYLGIRAIGYNMFPEIEGIRIRCKFPDDVRVFELNGRRYMKFSIACGDIRHITYDISNSRYDVEILTDELSLRPIELMPQDVLNNWIGFVKPTKRYAGPAENPVPRLSLEIQKHNAYNPSYVDDAISIVDAMKEHFINKGCKLYTDRMEYYLWNSQRILDDQFKNAQFLSPRVAFGIKKDECRMLFDYLHKSCTKIPHTA